MHFQAMALVTILSQRLSIESEGDSRSCSLVIRHGGDDYFEIDVIAESGIVATLGIGAGDAQALAGKLHQATELYTEYEPDDYEALKAHWIRENPISTPEEYTAAMKKIAEDCGV